MQNSWEDYTEVHISRKESFYSFFFFEGIRVWGGGETWEYENLSVNCSDTGRDDRWRGVSLDRYYRLDTD